MLSFAEMVDAITRWLSDTGNWNLILLGAMFVGAAWALYQHFHKKKENSIGSIQTGDNSPVFAPGRDLNVAGDFNVNTSSGISKEEISQAVIEGFQKIVKQQNLSFEETETKLCEMTERYNSLLAELTAYRSNDPELAELKEKAAEALEAGNFQEAENMLHDAEIRDLKAAGKAHEAADLRLRGASVSRAELGYLKFLQLAYREAAAHLQVAVELVPEGHDQLRSGYLTALGLALFEAGDYSAAQKPLEEAVSCNRKIAIPENLLLATELNNLAALYNAQGKYAEAEPLYRQALEIRKKILGLEHPDVAMSLNNLAEFYREQGMHVKAEPLYRAALEINEKDLGPNHKYVAMILNNLALLLEAQGNYDAVEPLYLRALEIVKLSLGPDHPFVAASLNNLASLYIVQGKCAEAEPLCYRALEIQEKSIGPEHPEIATSMNNLAELYIKQGKYAESEKLFKRALEIFEKAVGSRHPDVATCLNNLAGLYRKQRNNKMAEMSYNRALEILEKSFGPTHFTVASCLNNLAEFYSSQSMHDKAEPLYRRALEIDEKTLGPEHPNTRTAAGNYAILLRKMGRASEALALEERYKLHK